MQTQEQAPFDPADPADAVFAAAVAAGCDHRIAEGIAYWRRIRPGPGVLPGRQHFDPLEIPDLLPFVGLTDVTYAPGPRLRVRVIGTRLADHFGGGIVGSYLDELIPDFENSQAGKDYLRVVREGVPVWYRGDQSARVGTKFHLPVERLFLPLAGNGRIVNMLLGIIVVSARSKSGLL
jgi:hypothetical protein